MEKKVVFFYSGKIKSLLTFADHISLAIYFIYFIVIKLVKEF